MVQLQNSSKKFNSGITLLELIVAITIASFLAMLIFGVFTDITKGFHTLSNRSAAVGTMISTKKRIDASLKDVEKILSINDSSITYINSLDSIYTIEFSCGKLIKNRSIICGNVENGRFTLSHKENSTGDILLWECLVDKKGWIGGAR